jgi:RNA exonuclease 4
MFSKGGKRRPKALKQLAQSELGLTIQEGQHSSVDDARAALYLYQKHAGVTLLAPFLTSSEAVAWC